MQAGSEYLHTTYYIEMHPWFWEMTLMSDSRIFQNKSVPDIIKALFQEFGYTDFKDKLHGTYKERIYCVQYQETTFDFILKAVCDSFGIDLNAGQYALVGSTLKSFLTYLHDKGDITFCFKNNMMVWGK